MTQLIRPESITASQNFTGAFTDVNTVTTNDSTFVFGGNNANNAFIEFGIQSPLNPAAGLFYVRFRVAKVNNGVLDEANGGGTVTVTPRVYLGTELIHTGTAVTTSGNWTTYSFDIDRSLLNNFVDLRLRFTQSGSGGGGNARASAISWVEAETPEEFIFTGTPVSYWDGSAWVGGSFKVWSGAEWNPAAAKIFNNSEWI